MTDLVFAWVEWLHLLLLIIGILILMFILIECARRKKNVLGWLGMNLVAINITFLPDLPMFRRYTEPVTLIALLGGIAPIVILIVYLSTRGKAPSLISERVESGQDITSPLKGNFQDISKCQGPHDSPVDSKEVLTKIYCPLCGTLNENAKFCASCGAKLL